APHRDLPAHLHEAGLREELLSRRPGPGPDRAHRLGQDGRRPRAAGRRASRIRRGAPCEVHRSRTARAPGARRDERSPRIGHVARRARRARREGMARRAPRGPGRKGEPMTTDGNPGPRRAGAWLLPALVLAAVAIAPARPQARAGKPLPPLTVRGSVPIWNV